MLLSKILGVGKESTMDTRVLCHLLHISEKCLREEVEDERREGIAILECEEEGQRCYYLAETPAEMKTFLRKHWEILPNSQKAMLIGTIYDFPVRYNPETYETKIALDEIDIA